MDLLKTILMNVKSKSKRQKLTGLFKDVLVFEEQQDSTWCIIVVQKIKRFIPLHRSKPANDQTSDVITTHFDYHSIDHNLLKLDILGHDDPTMIRFLEDMTGIDATKIPLDEPKVMSLFRSGKALGVKPEDIGGITLGSLGIPEFGTDFVMQMLIETQQRLFRSDSDLWIISRNRCMDQ